MDAFFDSVTNSSSSSSTPHTPSPRLEVHEMSGPPFADSPPAHVGMPSDYPAHNFGSLEFHPQALDTDDKSRSNEPPQFWQAQGGIPPRGFLSELYEGQMKMEDPASPHDAYLSSGAASGVYRPEWQLAHPGDSFGAGVEHLSPDHLTPPEPQFYRRSSFPFVQHDLVDEGNVPAPSDPHFMSHYGGSKYVFSEPLPITADPSALSHHAEDPFGHSLSPPREFDDASVDPAVGPNPTPVKTERSSPVIVPSQAAFYRPSSSSSSLSSSSAPAFIPPHGSLPIMHTDDSASKETQYLRRRCFNCHTTEPPSWRRSTLNPGKIVCNKCGLYERTHLRPRPHRFDELRAGNKARKAPKSLDPSPTGSPKSKHGVVKKEPKEIDFRQQPQQDPRRTSVVSLSSSSGQSDWDESSGYPSASSAPTSSYNSPMTTTFSIPRPAQSQSPPGSRDGPIRLPQAPLTDIAARLKSPSKTHSAPYLHPYLDSRPPALGGPVRPSADYFVRRGSYDHSINNTRRHTVAAGMPQVSGWQQMPMGPANAPSKTRKIAA